MYDQRAMQNSQSPIVRATSVTLLDGQVAPPPDLTKLQNPYKKPMWLSEIQFNISYVGGVSVVGPWADFAIWVDLKLGRLPITKSYVPIPLVGQQVGYPNTLSILPNPNLPQRCYTLRFSKPLFIPSGQYITPQFFSNARFFTVGGVAPTLGSVTIDIAMRGRPLRDDEEVEPSQFDLPYIAGWMPPSLLSLVPTGKFTGTQKSTATDLANATRNEVNIDRFMAYPLIWDVANSLYGVSALNSILLRMYDNRKNRIVRQQTYMEDLFPTSDSHVWRARSTIPKQGFITAELYSSSFPGLPDPAGPNIYGMMSMIGSRVVNLGEVA